MSCKNCDQKDWVAIKDYTGAFISVPPQAYKLIRRMREDHDEALQALASVTGTLEDFEKSTWCMRGKRRATLRVVLENSNRVLKSNPTACKMGNIS